MQRDLLIYIQAVDELRRRKKISIDDFIDTITSERSYRRYLNGSLPIPLDVLEKLVTKLNVDITDILFYIFHVKQKPSGILESMKFIYLDDLEHAKTYVEPLRDYQKDSIQLNTLVSLFVNWYDVKKENKPFDTLIASIQHNRKHFDPMLSSIESLSYAIFSYYHGVLEHVHIERIITQLLEANFHYTQILLYDLIMDMFLQTYQKDPSFHKEMYYSLAKHFHEVSHMWLDHMFITLAFYHIGYASYLMEKPDYVKYLDRYLTGHYLFHDNPHFKNNLNTIESIFNKPIDTYLKEKLLGDLYD